MLRNSAAPLALCAASVLLVRLVWAQAEQMHPPAYQGVRTLVDGVFVTPIPGAPFLAVVNLQSTRALADGASETLHSIANIARDSQGRIYNERRELLPTSSTETSEVLSSHIFDPDTRISTFLNPVTRIARQRKIPQPLISPSNGDAKKEELGTEVLEGVSVHGTRETEVVLYPGKGKQIAVITENWYSDELHMNMLTRNSDPRTGVQVIRVTHVNRTEPDPSLFEVPAQYKVVDVNPPN